MGKFADKQNTAELLFAVAGIDILDLADLITQPGTQKALPTTSGFTTVVKGS